MFILVTLNLGTVSYRATTVANAADSTALYLGSTLVSKAHYLYVALGNSYSKCSSSGLLGVVLAFIVALVLTICCPPAGLWGG